MKRTPAVLLLAAALAACSGEPSNSDIESALDKHFTQAQAAGDAAMTAMLVIAGQMISGVAADLVGGAPGALVPKMLGVALILGGMRLAQRRFRRGPDQSSTR